MEELKSCIFCGKGVDRDYAFCPWCGYEFGPGDDVPEVRESPPSSAAEDDVDSGNRCEGPRDDTSERRCESLAAALFGPPRAASAATEAPTPQLPAADPLPSMLRRLAMLEALLADMEEELDLMLRNASAGP